MLNISRDITRQNTLMSWLGVVNATELDTIDWDEQLQQQVANKSGLFLKQLQQKKKSIWLYCYWIGRQ